MAHQVKRPLPQSGHGRCQRTGNLTATATGTSTYTAADRATSYFVACLGQHGAKCAAHEIRGDHAPLLDGEPEPLRAHSGVGQQARHVPRALNEIAHGHGPHVGQRKRRR